MKTYEMDKTFILMALMLIGTAAWIGLVIYGLIKLVLRLF